MRCIRSKIGIFPPFILNIIGEKTRGSGLVWPVLSYPTYYSCGIVTIITAKNSGDQEEQNVLAASFRRGGIYIRSSKSKGRKSTTRGGSMLNFSLLLLLDALPIYIPGTWYLPGSLTIGQLITSRIVYRIKDSA